MTSAAGIASPEGARSAERRHGPDGTVRTVVHLLRHGEVHNPEAILYGRLPGYRLSDLGQQMAATVAEHLTDHDVTRVVASPLDRAQQTARPIAAQHGLPIETDDDLLEAANLFEGSAFRARRLASPRTWPLLRNPLLPSWGEPYAEIATRMMAAIERARVAAAGHEVVLVSHQLPIWTVRRHIEGRRLWHDPRRRECSLASLTSLTFDDDRLMAIAYSEPAGRLLAQASAAVGA